MLSISFFTLLMLFATSPVFAQTIKEDIPTTMFLYYVPFGAEVHMGVTMESIEQHATDIFWFTSGHPQIMKTYRLLTFRPDNKLLRSSFIRLKVVLGRDVFFVDNGGLIVRPKVGKGYRLLKEELYALDKDIERFRGVVDLRAAAKFKSDGAVSGTKSGTGEDEKKKSKN